MTTQAHLDKYEALCAEHHVAWDENSPTLVGETLESLKAKYEEDEHLNNVPLRKWDALADAFRAYNRTNLSLAELVCMQKHCARKLMTEAS